MNQYILRRLLLLLPTAVLVSLIIFAVIRSIPGDITALMVQEHAYADTVQELRKTLGLDRPVLAQYFSWMGDLLQGDLGISLWSKRPIVQELGPRLLVTLELAGLAMVLALLMALPVGILSAIRQDTVMDYIARSLSILALAVPGFWLGLLLILYGGIWFNWMPPIRYSTPWEDPWRNLLQIIFPALILGFNRAGTIMRMTRATMLEVVRQDYIRTAWAKGLKERVVIYRHAVKNAMIPVLTVIGIQIAHLISGTVVLEKVFTLPGLGSFLVDSINQRDYPLVQGITLGFAGFVVLINLAVDLTYGYLDPRIRYV